MQVPTAWTGSHCMQDPEGLLAAPRGDHIQRRTMAKQIAQDKELAAKVEKEREEARQQLLREREVRDGCIVQLHKDYGAFSRHIWSLCSVFFFISRAQCVVSCLHKDFWAPPHAKFGLQEWPALSKRSLNGTHRRGSHQMTKERSLSICSIWRWGSWSSRSLGAGQS
jgi:hypothetical protein